MHGGEQFGKAYISILQSPIKAAIRYLKSQKVDYFNSTKSD